MDDPRVADVHRRIEALMQGVTAETPHERVLAIKEDVNRLKKQLPVIIPGAHSLTGHRRAKSPNGLWSGWPVSWASRTTTVR